jgi:hypothetical protein
MEQNDLNKIKHNLSPEAQRKFEPAEFNKSATVETIYKIQEQNIKSAEQTGDRQKIREAHDFARKLEGEIRFLRHSK